MSEMTKLGVQELVRGLAGRVPLDHLEDAQQYLDEDEWALALEVVANALFERGQVLTPTELTRFNEVAEFIGEPEGKYGFLGGLG